MGDLEDIEMSGTYDLSEPRSVKEFLISTDRKVIVWRGENYYTMEEALRVFLKNVTDPTVHTEFRFRS